MCGSSVTRRPSNGNTAGQGKASRDEIETVLQSAGTAKVLEAVYVDEGHEALLFRDGRFDRSLQPGVYALWKHVARSEARVSGSPRPHPAG